MPDKPVMRLLSLKINWAQMRNISIAGCPYAKATYNQISNSSGYGIGVRSGVNTGDWSNNVTLAYDIVYNLTESAMARSIMALISTVLQQMDLCMETPFPRSQFTTRLWKGTAVNRQMDGLLGIISLIVATIKKCSGESLCFYINADLTTSTLTFSNNIWSVPSSSPAAFEYPISTYISFSQFESLVNETNSQSVSDPKFSNLTAGDLWLASSSPAIGVALNLGSTYEYALDPASTWPSGVILDNQNSFGSGWDIGAYVYTQTSTPAIAWLSPSNGSTVSSTITISASSTAVSPASIANLQFYLDGSPLGSPITSTSSPNTYSYSWNTASSTNASHTLYALATDNYGNAASSSPITVTVQNQAVLSVTTSTSLSFSAAQGSIATSSQSIVVLNAGGPSSTLSWSAMRHPDMAHVLSRI